MENSSPYIYMLYVLQGIVREKLTVETLLGMSSSELRRLMDCFNGNEEDVIKLALSLRNIKIWTGNYTVQSSVLI